MQQVCARDSPVSKTLESGVGSGLIFETITGKLLTGIQLVADISATSPHHFLVFCHIFANFWRKIKVDTVLES